MSLLSFAASSSPGSVVSSGYLVSGHSDNGVSVYSDTRGVRRGSADGRWWGES